MNSPRNERLIFCDEETLHRIRNRAAYDPPLVTTKYRDIPITISDKLPKDTILLVNAEGHTQDVSYDFGLAGSMQECPSCEQNTLSKYSPDYICEECRGI